MCILRRKPPHCLCWAITLLPRGLCSEWPQMRCKVFQTRNQWLSCKFVPLPHLGSLGKKERLTSCSFWVLEPCKEPSTQMVLNRSSLAWASSGTLTPIVFVLGWRSEPGTGGENHVPACLKLGWRWTNGHFLAGPLDFSLLGTVDPGQSGDWGRVLGTASGQEEAEVLFRDLLS